MKLFDQQLNRAVYGTVSNTQWLPARMWQLRSLWACCVSRMHITTCSWMFSAWVPYYWSLQRDGASWPCNQAP